LLGIPAQELLDVLNTQLENNHSTKLEWIVISLIVVEVSAANKSHDQHTTGVLTAQYSRGKPY
jgi:hypothetical protein